MGQAALRLCSGWSEGGQHLSLSHSCPPCSQDTGRCPRRVSTVACVHAPRPAADCHGTCVEAPLVHRALLGGVLPATSWTVAPPTVASTGSCTESEWWLCGGSPARCPAPHGPGPAQSSPGFLGLVLAAGCRCEAGWTGSNCSEGKRPGQPPPGTSWALGLGVIAEPPQPALDPRLLVC